MMYTLSTTKIQYSTSKLLFYFQIQEPILLYAQVITVLLEALQIAMYIRWPHLMTSFQINIWKMDSKSVENIQIMFEYKSFHKGTSKKQNPNLILQYHT